MRHGGGLRVGEPADGIIEIGKEGDHRGFDRLAHDRHDDEEAPHAVDDGGHSGEQFDGGANRPAHPLRRQFGEIEGDAEG